MAQEASMRKRKVQLEEDPSSPVEHTDESEDLKPYKAPTTNQSALIYLAVLFSFTILIGQFPDLPSQLLSKWTQGSGSGSLILPEQPTAPADFSADIPKRDAIVDAFKHAWHAYERDALGADEYHPLSRSGSNLTAAGGIGYTVVDSLDTMLLMGLTPEYERARAWVDTRLSFDRDATFNTFETTIRVLGGLLTAHHLTDDALFLTRATDLGERLLPVFDTPSGLPLSGVNLARRVGVPDADNSGFVSTAEAATLQLELRWLAELTGREEFWEKAENVMATIRRASMPAGLASIFMNPENGQFIPSDIRLGSRGDSFYEYLLKQWLQTNRTEDVYRTMYDDAMSAVHTHLVKKSKTGLTYTAELLPERSGYTGDISWRLVPKQDHLVCFLGGSLMLGAASAPASGVERVSIPPLRGELGQGAARDWKTGVELTETCMQTHNTKTGLSAEIVHFHIPGDGADGAVERDWYIKGTRPGENLVLDARYILRPETVESLFLAFRLTGDAKYREQGWQIFQAIEKHCRVPGGGYAAVRSVEEVPAVLEDKMETFLMSETLKYLFLLFSDDSVLPLDKYVFNTEAHPLPVFTPSFDTGFS